MRGMERKRKGYLLRKNNSFDNIRFKKQIPSNGELVCLCNKNGTSRTYDLQTQTVTFGEEETSSKPKKKVFSRSSLLKKFTSDDIQKTSKKNKSEMDQDLEFYPVDDHPSPSTFTAWDAFLAGNQAFFREPACLVPDPAFSYMDVIPEEDDDVEALLESDTDDTGSSVSTVIDRFSRTSTANSSFSERCKGSSGDVTFDLEKVLSPFERLEKELDAHHIKDFDQSSLPKDIQRGPIVVITNSSSCEDVHSAGEDETPLETIQNSSESVKSSNLNGSAEAADDEQSEPQNEEATIPQEIKPTTPMRQKMVNGVKNSEKITTKQKMPCLSAPSLKAKKSYPTPSVPPRMSKHLPARRTRSDPGSTDQPSRIPRPISSSNRSSSNIPSPKTNNRNSRSQKLGFMKRQVSQENLKSTKTEPLSNTFEITSVDTSFSETSKESEKSPPTSPDNVETASDNKVDDVKETNTSPILELEQKCSSDGDPVDECSISYAPSESTSNDFSQSIAKNDLEVTPNHLKQNETNPFRNTEETKNPFVRKNNPFEDNEVDENLPALPSKGQISAALFAPPVPERTIPVSTENGENSTQRCPTVIQLSTSIETIKDGEIVLSAQNACESMLIEIPAEHSSPRECPPTHNSGVQEEGEGGEDLPHQRPIEDILQALDQLVLPAPPREVEINIEWEARGPVNIREKRVDPSTASGDGSTDSETEGLSPDRKLSIENLLKEVDECLREENVGEETHVDINESPTSERIQLSPGSLDAPTAGSTKLSLSHQHALFTDDTVQPDHTPQEMLRHREQRFLADEQRVILTSAYQEAFRNSTEDLDFKHHSPGCDDSGVFLEDSVASSPETHSKSSSARLQNNLQKFSDLPATMKQYSVPEGIDSDAERSDDLGLASSSIDSADDLDGDPLPSMLNIGPPAVPTRQKPPPIPARKSLSKVSDSQKNNRFYRNEVITLEVPNPNKTPLCKSSSSGEDSNFGEGDVFPNEDYLPSVTMRENAKNFLNNQKNQQSRNNFAMTRSFHEDALMNLQRDTNHDSKSDFLARTLSSPKKLDTRNGDSGFKWKSEECLRTAAESKWCLPGRRYEKSVSVKDRIAMFSEMEANQSTDKKDLHRYGSETNIKTVESKRMNLPVDIPKHDSLSRDSKWHSMQSITKQTSEKETSCKHSPMKPAVSIPSLTPDPVIDDPVIDNLSYNSYATLPVKLDVEIPKPIISTYPETQLTNNKRYNYGLYSLKNLKNTEDLLSKKSSGSNLLSLIDSRKQPLGKLKGLVIPEKPFQPNTGKDLPTIVSSDSEVRKDTRRASLPITVVTGSNSSMSLPRNQKLERPPTQKQTSLVEPPWKNESKITTNTLPKYSPAFKKRTLELPGSSLSPTPPSSITSPLSPPPSSPSSICSSNASSTLQQNVFQFSLSHSKPVQPLQPEKALMSPPSLPSDVEYEGDNSEDSSHSASPMRNGTHNSKDAKSSNHSFGNNSCQYGESNAFTSTTRTVSHQPLMVETLTKSSRTTEHPRAAVCISKTEIHLKSQKSVDATIQPESISKTVVSTFNHDSQSFTATKKMEATSINNKNGTTTSYFTSHSVDSYNNLQNRNGSPEQLSKYSEEVPVGKFRALPLNFQESQVKDSFITKSSKHKLENVRPPPSECDDSEDDDSHSTLSHRTEDSRHTTTDDCLSDATTDSFEKPRLMHPDDNRNVVDDNASTEGYLSDASTTDVSLRRFAHRPIDYSAEEYFSDATAESPDPEWMSSRGHHNGDLRFRSHMMRNDTNRQPKDNDDSEIADPDLRPKRLSQQRTVLKASMEPTDSVQKFKALAEKWEQRTDVTSPPPPPPPVISTNGMKKDSRSNSIAAVILSNNSSTVIKGKSNLPPSLMPRNSSDKMMSRTTSRDSSHSINRPKENDDVLLGKKSLLHSTSISPESSTNSWNHHYNEAQHLETSLGGESLSSNSSKITLKESREIVDSKTIDPPVLLTNGTSIKTNSFVERKSDDLWNNEPRNRRGADFTRADWTSRPSVTAKTSVSDIRRSFENGTKEPEKVPSSKKPPLPARAPTSPPPVPLPRQQSPRESEEDDEEIKKLLDEARMQLQQEGLSGHLSVHHVLLRREGLDGGSVGITLAGGADYEVKEITVHKVISGSLADRNGLVLKGDRVMSINGRNLRGVSHGEALHILKAPNPKVLLVLARNSDCLSNGTDHAKQDAIVTNKDPGTFSVALQKDATGVGFSIEGGKDSPQGDRPLLIKRVFKGSVADKEGRLEEGDEILAINEHPVNNMTRTEAWNFLKKLPEGYIHLKLKKSSS
ncbi:uncharacterized protein [Parasteatoda tepidariorum]|uniref:uncharacterized protein isoform X2 n=1 Tax=Parasteatoda tepidariorum TaxID=114398 RepID=UPI0039BCB1EB